MICIAGGHHRKRGRVLTFEVAYKKKTGSRLRITHEPCRREARTGGHYNNRHRECIEAI
jgi:hypothetical protein